MRILFTFLVFYFFAGCQSSRIVQPESSGVPDYSIIYIIHGDANYLYHNAKGNALEADEKVLEEAKAVGRKAKNGEVFIFHQKPERKILWLFPKKDRRFLQYRNGRLVRDRRYSPQSTGNAFTVEAGFYKQYSKVTQKAATEKVFLYFGHEIPAKNRLGYFASRPEANFGTDLFAKGVESFLPDPNARFDLTVLSTCNNGTPAMVQDLSPRSRYVLASPQNLHLSHIDTDRLATLLEQPDRATDIESIANSLANQTYRRLSTFLQTVITLSVYDTKMTKSYLPSLNRSYQSYLSDRADSKSPRDNIDCAGLPFFEAGEDTSGIEIWYKPPRFGQKERTRQFSGWGCRGREL